MARKPRDTNKYNLKVGRRIVHRGITNDLERREREHRRTWPTARIEKVGRITTREGAREWERRNGA